MTINGRTLNNITGRQTNVGTSEADFRSASVDVATEVNRLQEDLDTEWIITLGGSGDILGEFNINPYTTDPKQWNIEATIDSDAVENHMIAPGAITVNSITDGSITTAKIADNAVTNVKIANDAITNEKIADASKRRFRILNAAGTVLFELDGIVPE